MFHHLPVSYLPLAALLLTAASCDRTADPAPLATTGTASYTLRTQPVSGTATSRVVSCSAQAITSSSGGFDYLQVVLTTTPAPAGQAEVVRLYYAKQTKNASNQYMFQDAVIDNAQLPKLAMHFSSGNSPEATNGGFSGTFGCFLTTQGGTPDQMTYTLTDGVFIAAR